MLLDFENIRSLFKVLRFRNSFMRMRKFVAVKLEVQCSAHLEAEMEMVGSYQGVKRFSPIKR